MAFKKSTEKESWIQQNENTPCRKLGSGQNPKTKGELMWMCLQCGGVTESSLIKQIRRPHKALRSRCAGSMQWQHSGAM